MHRREKPAQASQATGPAAQRTVSTGNAHRYHFSTFEPFVVEVWKREGWRKVAKVTFLDGGNREPILAIVHRNQQGTASRVSLPVSIIRLAKEHGAKWFYFRRDKTGEMWRMPLCEVEKCPLGPSVGGMEAERYIEIAKMERAAWRKWAWADRVVRLGDSPLKGSDPESQIRPSLLLMFGDKP